MDNVADKVSNQSMLRFPTSPNWYFCTTQWIKKPTNFVFHLNCNTISWFSSFCAFTRQCRSIN